MRLGIVSDEISKNFEEALTYAQEWGISHFELRVIQSGRVPYVDSDEVDWVLKLLKKKSAYVTALSPGILKAPLREKDVLRKETKETIFETFRLAEKFGTHRIIVFGIQREENEPDSHYDDALNLLGEMAVLGQKNGFTIFVENEPGFWCDTGKNTAKILQTIHSEFLRANWDPGNALWAGEIPYPDGYEAIKNFMGNFHAKDYTRQPDGSFECRVIGEGDIDYENHVKAVLKDQVVEQITIETHCEPLLEKSQKNAAILKKWLDQS